MAKKTQFYAYKLSLKRIMSNDKVIKDMNIKKARQNDELIGITDNQVLKHLRIIYDTDLKELEELKNKREDLRNKKTSSKVLEKLDETIARINKILLIDEIVNVVVDSEDNNKDYDELVKKGFMVNGIRYTRLACGSGMARRATVSFFREDIFDNMHEKLMNGLELTEINIAKLNAYYGLYLSGCEFVSEPNQVVVIPDYEPILKDKKVDWIYDVATVDEKGRKYEYRDIEEKVMDIKANVFDGQGLISPSLCRKWSEDLELDYIPCSFIIRTCFTKGLVVEFDFHKYAKENGITTIKDKWGKIYDIEKVDMILTESQMKMHKYYKSWDEFLKYHKKYKHSWGVTRYNKPPYKEDVMTRLNYQYIQTLSLDKEKVIKLAEPTLEWIKKVCEGDKLYSLLFLLGVSKETDVISEVFDKVNNTYVQAIINNDRFLKEEQIQKFMYNSIKKYIKESKIGKLWVEGKYEFMISDPYALTQWALGKEVTGLLNEHEHWSKNKTGKYDGCRSPLVDSSEHNPLNFIHTDDTRKWFSQIDTGIIYNIFGLDTIIHSDSD